MDPRLAPDVFWPRLERALATVEPATSEPPPDARAGAVLVLLEDTDLGPAVVLTRRRRDLRSHPGQISFPGGRIDAGESVEEAALREAVEEVALDLDSVEVLGRGPRFYIPPSRFWVVPVVARWVAPHDLDPNPWEVDTILRVPIGQLLEEPRLRHVPLSLRGSSWAWQLDEDLLWGATAIVMSLLLQAAVGVDWTGGRQPGDLGEALVVKPWETAPAVPRRARLDGELPAVPQAEVTHVSAAAMRAVDRLLAQSGLGLAALAEHAGRGLAHAVRRLVGTSLADIDVLVLAGPGGNGAGGLAGARLLAAGGARVRVAATGDLRLPEQRTLLELAGVPFAVVTDEALGALAPAEVVIDAMLGTGAHPPLRGTPEQVAAWLREYDLPVVALDLPSGLDADDGLHGPCVNADVTVTLGAPKLGLRPRVVHPYVGDLYLADLGIPPELWHRAGVPDPPLFAAGPLVRLTLDEAGPDAGTPDQAEPA